MLCEKILGTYTDEAFQNLTIDYVEIEWHEAFKKLHKKTTRGGREIGIRLGNDILTKGLNQGDVLYADDSICVVVDIPPCQVIKAALKDEHHKHMLVKTAYEIGNRHATAFWGDSYEEILTPYSKAMEDVLSKIHGITLTVETVKLDFSRSISSTINNHTH